MRGDASEVLSLVPEALGLQDICEALNSAENSGVREELRKLVERWKKSGPNLEQMLENDPRLLRELERMWRMKYILHKSGKATLAVDVKRPSTRVEEDAKPHLHRQAVSLFAAFTLMPDLNQLRGPCEYGRCGKYFVAGRKPDTPYCSRTCSQRASASLNTKRKQDETRRDKLHRAAVAIREWETGRRNVEWRDWVCAQHTDITPKFLTRALRKRDLLPPDSSTP